MPPLRLKASPKATTRISAPTVARSRVEKRQRCSPCSFLPFCSSLLDLRLGRTLGRLASASHEPAVLLPRVRPPGKRPSQCTFLSSAWPDVHAMSLHTLQADTCPCTHRTEAPSPSRPQERKSVVRITSSLRCLHHVPYTNTNLPNWQFFRG